MSLASTADKAKIIEACSLSVIKVSPKGIIALLIAFILGVAIPPGIIYLRELLRQTILGHDDVEKLTQLPIIGDIPYCQRQRKQGQYRDTGKQEQPDVGNIQRIAYQPATGR